MAGQKITGASRGKTASPRKTQRGGAATAVLNQKLQFLRETTELIRGFADLSSAADGDLKRREEPRPLSRSERAKLTRMLAEVDRGFETIDALIASEEARLAREPRPKSRRRGRKVA